MTAQASFAELHSIADHSAITHAYAFFDVDDTLISVKSLLRFQEYWYEWKRDPDGYRAYQSEINDLVSQDAPWEYVNRRYYAYFENRSVAEVEQCARLWFANVQEELKLQNQSLFHAAIVTRLHQHRGNGIEPVFVSGSFPLLLNPIAECLHVKHVLAIKQQIIDGRFTGHILSPQTIGQGKADAVAEFLNDKSVLAADCFAYGDDISDAPMLSSVGYPFVVKGGRRLELHALQYGWPAIDPN